MQSKITLRAMYNFDNTLFDKLSFPAGIDHDLAINVILNKSEEFELVYSDFEYLQDRIGIWGEMWERTFTKWVAALSEEYDPLHNYDRHEIYKDIKKSDYKDVTGESSTSNSSTTTSSTSSSNTEEKTSAYDEATYSDKQKEIASALTNQSGNGNASGKVDRNSSGDANETLDHDAHLYGNIGVTTSQQMLKDELDIVTWNLYEHISDIFIEEFCILIY